MIIPFIDVLNRVSLRIVTMPIQSQGIITRDNVSVDVSAVAYFGSRLVELGVDKNTTVVFPTPLMSTIGELGSLLARENAAATAGPSTPVAPLIPAVLPVQPQTTNDKPLPATG